MRSSSGKKPKALIINNYITSLKSSKIPSVNIQVFCRFKPLTQEESEQENEINLKNDNQSITLNQPNQINLCIDNKKDLKENYNFEAIFDENNSKEEIYTLSCKEIVNKVLQGYNGALICFGQTGMGKTFTINDLLGQIGNHIFNEIEKVANVNNLFKVEVAGFEIFKEQINDTLDLINLNLNLKENKNKRTFVDNLTFFSVLDAEDFVDIVSKALFKRNNTSLSMKEYTSRCNNIIVVNVYRYTKEKKQLRTGCLYLVDLEGSEKMTKNKIEGVSHEEKKILNKSLQALRHLVQTLNVIKKESLTMSTYIPYRESKLTQILCDCFGGNCYTSMILNCSLSSLYFEETRNTLLFGQSVKNILNKPKENVENNADKNPIVLEMLALYMESMKNKKSKEENKVIKKLENEILALKKQIKELENKIKGYVKTIKELKNKIKYYEDIESKYEELKNKYKISKNENIELKGNIPLLEAKINQYEEMVKKLTEENEKLKKNEIKINKINNELKSKKEKLEKKCEENETLIDEQKNKINEYEKDLLTKTEKIKLLEEKNDKVNKEYNKYKAEKEKLIINLENDLEEKKDVIKKEKNENKNLTKINDNLKKEIEDKDFQIKSLENQAESNAQKINNLTANNTKYKQKIESLESDIRKINDENEKKVDELEEEINTVKNNNEQLVHDNKLKNEKIKELDKKNKNLEENLKEKEKNIKKKIHQYEKKTKKSGN